MKIAPDIRTLVKRIKQVKEQQRLLGLFCDDRELLSCARCGLDEDVTFEGFLIVTKLANLGIDTGLRFSAIDEKRGVYQCPSCGDEVTVEKGVDYRDRPALI